MNCVKNIFQPLFKEVHDAVLIGSKNGKIVYLNPAAERLTGYSISDCKPFSWKQFLPQVSEQIQSNKSGRCKTVLTLKNQVSFEISLQWEKVRLPCHSYIQMIIWETGKDAFAEFGPEFQHLFKSVFEHIPDQVFIKDRHHRMVVCNRATSINLGEEDPDRIIGKCDHDFFEKKVADVFRTIENEVLNKGRQMGDIEEEYVNAQGKRCFLLSTKVPLRNTGGETVGLIGINRDITERKKMEDDLRDAREKAERAAQAKSIFLANMSHEIRTPLNAVVGMSNLLADTSLTEEQLDFVETINTSSDALLGIVNNILDLSKIEAGKFELEDSPFNLIHTVEKSVDLVAPKATEKGLELMQYFCGEVPEVVVGDAARLRQILLNLLSNSIKFTPHGEVLVEIEGKQIQDQEYRINFCVSDTGIGMTQEEADRVFQPFEQADSSTTRKYGGTGLGLTICNKLVQMMGGEIKVTSQKNVGSEFRFHIVARRSDDADLPEIPFDPEVLKGCRALVVDDNRTNLKILKHELENCGMVPLIFDSAIEALEKMDTLGELDIAVLDFTMPDMDGCTLANQLRNRPEFGDKPILILSSSGRPRTMTPGNVNRWLSKPVKERRLQEALASLLGGLIEDAATETHEEMDDKLAEKFPYRILLAEDNKVNQKVTLKMLSKLGYNADLAENGQETVDMALKKSYDLILMDIQMPGIDGIEATEIICEKLKNRNCPTIIGLSAHALKESREEALHEGMSDYLSKPVKMPDLIQALKNNHSR